MRLIYNDIIPGIKGEMDHKLDRLSQKLKLMEIRDGRMNLLFYGVEQKPNENVYEQLRKCWQTDFGLSEEDANAFQMVDRLPRKGLDSGPDPIIACFVYFEEREWFLAAAKKHPFNNENKPVMVYTDLPQDMKKARGTATREAKQMRSEGKQARIRVIGTRVILNTEINLSQVKHLAVGLNRFLSYFG